jgi:hypothetical protein
MLKKYNAPLIIYLPMFRKRNLSHKIYMHTIQVYAILNLTQFITHTLSQGSMTAILSDISTFVVCLAINIVIRLKTIWTGDQVLHFLM